ncbi:hypothetical protein KR093_006661 [Drosophila rubida]|uniref:Mucin-5AC n=1 Tax=Drosophila rubida TaxID=30044 RepID=A0AAD4PRK8_9MUSC|nr:hypothetical protein KR093_006661 [Drosophila rubida]
MTFYWWSHWFWITCLSVQLLPSGIPLVHTYPSQELSPEATTPQHNRMELSDGGRRQPATATATTKLYQTTSSQGWTAATQRNIMDLTIKTTAASSTTSSTYTPLEQQNSNDGDGDGDDEDEDINADEVEEIDVEVAEEVVDAEPATLQHNQLEFKRSADFAAEVAGTEAAEAAAVAGNSQAEQLNNYTNFSRSTSTVLAATTTLAATTRRTTTMMMTTTRTTTKATTTTTKATTTTTTTATATATANSTAQSQLAATPSTPKINTEWLSDELQKAPFTLENANKEEELRRAESEHRSRKSKVLSAEYKHINRYINFSSDTKSLLTRSASATPSISGYNPDEGNISSEALAIQRTYFLDAGAISAICFTVFGICCTVGTIGIVLYRRRYLNKPQALSEPDSSVYIDDSTMRVSVSCSPSGVHSLLLANLSISNLVLQDNSDEMYSLDNDSFLNSLEAMTIQNYWTDTVKHTKL